MRVIDLIEKLKLEDPNTVVISNIMFNGELIEASNLKTVNGEIINAEFTDFHGQPVEVPILIKNPNGPKKYLKID